VISVVSNAWLLDGPEHAAAYVEICTQFDELHRANGGYRGRKLMLGIDDRSHLLNVRFFDAVTDYERLTQHPDYSSWINRLSAHVLARSPNKEYLEVLLDTSDPDNGEL
jgi:hypothetical protein